MPRSASKPRRNSVSRASATLSCSRVLEVVLSEEPPSVESWRDDGLEHGGSSVEDDDTDEDASDNKLLEIVPSKGSSDSGSRIAEAIAAVSTTGLDSISGILSAARRIPGMNEVVPDDTLTTSLEACYYKR